VSECHVKRYKIEYAPAIACKPPAKSPPVIAPAMAPNPAAGAAFNDVVVDWIGFTGRSAIDL
jgi:hypothetical protein